MIGLGSNRLTVCRRGGMSVTQAGKGGMEWLGVRYPSWATPYSAQATAALKAQFPTQWPTIRDYGLAHPALVPFINEDPMLVMSLIEGLGTRWIANNGSAYFIAKKAISVADVEIGCKYMQVANTSRSHIWGSTQSGTNNFKLNPFGGATYNLWSRGSSVGLSFVAPIGVVTDFVVKATNAHIELTVNGTKTEKNFTSDLVGGVPFALFHVNGVTSSYNPVNGKMADWYFKQAGVLIERYVPFIRNDQAEMLDLVSGELAERHGTLTISESPS